MRGSVGLRGLRGVRGLPGWPLKRNSFWGLLVLLWAAPGRGLPPGMQLEPRRAPRGCDVVCKGCTRCLALRS